MKDGFIFKETPLVSVPSENEVQKRLRAILDYWGPSGERHLSDPNDPEGFAASSGDGCRVCAQVAHHRTSSVMAWHGSRDRDCIEQAAKEMGFRDYHICSNSSFDNASAMVLRAIELAA